jgi:hypothetical protein
VCFTALVDVSVDFLDAQAYGAIMKRFRRNGGPMTSIAIGLTLVILAVPPVNAQGSGQISTDTSYGITGADQQLCELTRDVGKLLPKGAKAVPKTWPVAENITEPVNDVVKVWRSGCTWGVTVKPLLIVNIQALYQNADYTGKTPWTPQKEVDTILAISDRPVAGGYISFDPTALAKTYKKKSPTANIYIVGDKGTQGKRRAILIVWDATTAYIFSVLSDRKTTDALRVAWLAGTEPNRLVRP